MFNPQRKNKIADIYMQEKYYKIHKDKMKKIGASRAKKVHDEQEEQSNYLVRLERTKEEIKNRLSSNLREENRRIMHKLVDVEHKSSFH